MGVGPGSRHRYSSPSPTVIERIVERVVEKVIPSPGNPNPAKYTVLSSLEVGKHLVVMLHYPDCKNYEGKKILLYENCRYADLMKQKYIDPHFSQARGFYSPIARFEPTPRGWEMAIRAAERLP